MSLQRDFEGQIRRKSQRSIKKLVFYQSLSLYFYNNCLQNVGELCNFVGENLKNVGRFCNYLRDNLRNRPFVPQLTLSRKQKS